MVAFFFLDQDTKDNGNYHEIFNKFSYNVFLIYVCVCVYVCCFKILFKTRSHCATKAGLVLRDPSACQNSMYATMPSQDIFLKIIGLFNCDTDPKCTVSTQAYLLHHLHGTRGQQDIDVNMRFTLQYHKQYILFFPSETGISYFLPTSMKLQQAHLLSDKYGVISDSSQLLKVLAARMHC